MTVPSSSPFAAIKDIHRNFNGPLFLSCTLIAISQFNFGLDQSVFGATQAMNDFTVKFGVFNATTKTYAIEPYFLSLLNSLTYVGFAFGLVTGSYISNRFGRRATMISMCIWAIIGAIILVTSHAKAQMIVGRVIAYIYIGMELAVVPILQSEIVPAHVRGFVVGTYQIGILVRTPFRESTNCGYGTALLIQGLTKTYRSARLSEVSYVGELAILLARLHGVSL